VRYQKQGSRFLDHEKTDHYYAEKILDDINRILVYSRRANFVDPSTNEEAIDAIDFRMIYLREMFEGLSSDFLRDHPKIDWEGVVSFPNQLAHNYGAVDFVFYRRFIEKDLSEMKRQFEAYLS